MSKKYIVKQGKSYPGKRGIIHPGGVVSADVLYMEPKEADEFLAKELKLGYIEPFGGKKEEKKQTSDEKKKPFLAGVEKKKDGEN